MIVFGILALIAGIASVIYGNSLNNSLEAQFNSLLNSGSANPGDMFLYIGIVVAAVGLILFIAGLVKANKNN